jgi:hypothetical protein
MIKLLCNINSKEKDDYSSVFIYVGMDDSNKPFWELVASYSTQFYHFGDPPFVASKGDWWYNHASRTLDIYSDGGKSGPTLEFSLAGLSDIFYLQGCGPDKVGSGIRFPKHAVEYRIGGSGTCERPVPKGRPGGR